MKYSEFIQEILDSRENKSFKGSECHHIIPKCEGGTNSSDNLVYLSPNEHFTAHKLLADENPENNNFQYALLRMCDGNRDITPEDYEKIRSKMSLIYSEKFSGEGNPFYGQAHSEETKEILRKNMKERIAITGNPFVGHTHSSESKKKMSESHRKQIWIKTLDESQEKLINREELQHYLDIGWATGRLRAQFLGEKNPFYGKHHSEEYKQNRRLNFSGSNSSLYGKSMSEEQKEKIRKKMIGRMYTKTCKICGCLFECKGANTSYCTDCKTSKL